jgi:probable LLM family oxidoreductase
MEIGLYTFAEVDPQPGERWAESAARRMRELMAEVETAERVGLDVFGIGEHHRPDYAVSAPVVALAAAAEHSERLKLTSAVTVLSSDDPVRVFQDFATLDLLSNGRAEIMAGRGSFIESFPLFGFDLDDYDELFDEKLKLLLALRDQERITWSGKHRPPIDDLAVYPRPLQEPLPVWVAVGGNPPSAIRAARLGLPMALAIIGGEPARFAPLVDLYRRAGGSKVSINSHTYVAETTQQAADDFFPGYSAMMSRIGRERGWPPLSRPQFDAGRSPRGALLVGSPDDVARKIVAQREIFGHDRFLAQINVGGLPHDKVLQAIELLGTEVAPRVRELAEQP